MRTIILEYDETDPKANEALGELFATDLFAEVILKCSEETLQAMEEIRTGDVVRYEDIDDMIKDILESDAL